MNKPASVSVEQRIDALKAERGECVPVDEIGEVVAAVLESVESGAESVELGNELRGLLDFINRAREELAAMRPKTMADRHIASARDELDAVVAHTEAAAGRFMDIADEMGRLAKEVDGRHSGRLSELSTEIFEVSTFQDITGQRVGKVVSVLHHIEERLTALAEAIGDTEVHEEVVVALDADGNVIDEAALKHGPQLEGEGNSQADIDALLASMD